jgi:hypothetical protein
LYWIRKVKVTQKLWLLIFVVKSRSFVKKDLKLICMLQ